MISDRLLYAFLAEGAPIIAARTVPNPHRYSLTSRGARYDMSTDRAQALVDGNVIVGKPDDALWDHITFRPVSREQVRTIAFAYFPRGWGYCCQCGEMMEPDPKLRATRHGHTYAVGPDGKVDRKTLATPPCDGSGKPLLSTTIPPGAVSVAA